MSDDRSNLEQLTYKATGGGRWQPPAASPVHQTELLNQIFEALGRLEADR